MMNLREWPDNQGIHPKTAYRWFRDGVLPFPARKMGEPILVGSLDQPHRRSDAVAIYACVSSSDQRGDLERQVARVTTRATSNGYTISRVVTEVGSGMNGERRKFLALWSDPGITTIVVAP